MAEGAADVVVEYIVVELYIVSYKHVAFAVAEETLQPFSAADPLAVEIDGEHGVVVAADDGGYFLGSFDDDVEVGAFDVLSSAHFYCGNLDDIVAEDVEAGGFGVEEHHFLGVEHLGKVLQVGAVVVEQ